MQKTIAIIALLAFNQSAFCQITDPDQRMRWFNLQRLAIEVRELENCQFFDMKDPRYGQAYARAADETGLAIEAYIAAYPSGRGRTETVSAYRYRVWQVAIRTGIEKSRQGAQLNESSCQLLLIGKN